MRVFLVMRLVNTKAFFKVNGNAFLSHKGTHSFSYAEDLEVQLWLKAVFSNPGHLDLNFLGRGQEVRDQIKA